MSRAARRVPTVAGHRSPSRASCSLARSNLYRAAAVGDNPQVHQRRQTAAGIAEPTAGAARSQSSTITLRIQDYHSTEMRDYQHFYSHMGSLPFACRGTRPIRTRMTTTYTGRTTLWYLCAPASTTRGGHNVHDGSAVIPPSVEDFLVSARAHMYAHIYNSLWATAHISTVSVS